MEIQIQIKSFGSIIKKETHMNGKKTESAHSSAKDVIDGVFDWERKILLQKLQEIFNDESNYNKDFFINVSVSVSDKPSE